MKVLKKILRFLLPLSLSAILIWWMFRKVDFHRVWAIMQGDVHYGWLIAVMGIVVLSHCIRGIRWGYQLRAAGVGNIPTMALCCSIFGAYSLNLLVPYMGEAWRIIYIAKRQDKPVSTVLGTDLGDRISDAIVVILLLILALIVGNPYIVSFLEKYAVGMKLLHVVRNPWLWIGIAGALGATCATLYLLRDKGAVKKFFISLNRVWVGFKVLFTMKGRWAYLWLTLGIWGCYFLETYVSFLAFPFTRELMAQPGLAWGLLPGLITFVFGSMSIAIPSNGGLGPWNLAVMFALSLFGVADTNGAAFSLLVWTAESLTLVLLGLYTIAYVMMSKTHKL